MEDKPYSSLKPSLDRLTLGVIRILETSPGVTEVMFVEKEPAERHSIISWEQKNSCVLPEDLKNFYLMSDGFHMTWSVKFDDNPMPLGSMMINSISKLCHLVGSSAYALPSAPTLADLEDDTDEEGNEDQPEKPHFDPRSLIFELDSCNGNGKVCLVYKHTKPVVTPDTEIWFLDRALYWHFLTDTFTAYYRLLITHLGLPQWQYAFTSYGISPQAKQWFNMYKPITINTALLAEEADSFVNKLDPNKVFKSKNKTPVLKKKLPSQPAGSQKSHTSTTSSKVSSLAGNSLRNENHKPDSGKQFHSWSLKPHCGVSSVRIKPLLMHEETSQCKPCCTICMKYNHNLLNGRHGWRLRKLQVLARCWLIPFCCAGQILLRWIKMPRKPLSWVECVTAGKVQQ